MAIPPQSLQTGANVEADRPSNPSNAQTPIGEAAGTINNFNSGHPNRSIEQLRNVINEAAKSPHTQHSAEEWIQAKPADTPAPDSLTKPDIVRLAIRQK